MIIVPLLAYSSIGCAKNTCESGQARGRHWAREATSTKLSGAQRGEAARAIVPIGMLELPRSAERPASQRANLSALLIDHSRRYFVHARNWLPHITTLRLTMRVYSS